jgi:hypothetical protein
MPILAYMQDAISSASSLFFDKPSSTVQAGIYHPPLWPVRAFGPALGGSYTKGDLLCKWPVRHTNFVRTSQLTSLGGVVYAGGPCRERGSYMPINTVGRKMFDVVRLPGDRSSRPTPITPAYMLFSIFRPPLHEEAYARILQISW